MMRDYLVSTFSLEGQTALVTGGSKGIGLMIATSLVKAGATVYIASRSQEACEAAAQKLAHYGTCIALPCDLSTVANITELAGQLATRTPQLDILVNNAGTTWAAEIDDFPEEKWDRVVDLNLKSPFFLVQKLLPLLERAGAPNAPARVINVGSVMGMAAATLTAYPYMASKAALHQLTRGLARDLVGRNITVNAIAPGFFPTKMTRFITADDALNAEILATIPMGRMGEPDEIGGLMLYLCSGAAAYMTGAIIPLDGGYLLDN